MVLLFPAAQGTPRVTLRVASFPSFDRALQAILPRWNELHPDVAIGLWSRRIGDHHDAMAHVLSAPAAEVPDVVGLSVDFLGRMKALELEELDGQPHLPNGWIEQLEPYAAAQARSPDGRLRVIPADVGPGVLFYRADLLAQAGIQEEELHSSWASFIEAGRRLKAATGASIISHPNYVKDCYLRARLGPDEGIYFAATGEPLVRTPRFREAFRLSIAVRDAGIDLGVAPTWAHSAAWTDGVRNGTIAAQLSGAWFLAHLSTWIAPETRGRWRTCGTPDSSGVAWGGAFYGIPRRAANKELAFDFIRLACLDSDVQLGCFRQQHAYPALLETRDDPAFDEPLPFLGGQVARRMWQRLVSHACPGPVHELDQVAEEAVTDQLCRVLETDKDVEAALADAERTIRARMSTLR
jgi:multiple sugar transport system substrate-binding protein